MTSGYFNRGISIIEILGGLVFIGISVYYLIEFQYCNPNAELCKPLTILPVTVFLVPGILVVGAGTISISKRDVAFWKAQLLMPALVSIYFTLLIATVYKLKG